MCRLVFINKLVTLCMSGLWAVICESYPFFLCYECWSAGVVLCMGEFAFKVMYQL